MTSCCAAPFQPACHNARSWSARGLFHRCHIPTTQPSTMNSTSPLPAPICLHTNTSHLRVSGTMPAALTVRCEVELSTLQTSGGSQHGTAAAAAAACQVGCCSAAAVVRGTCWQSRPVLHCLKMGHSPACTCQWAAWQSPLQYLQHMHSVRSRTCINTEPAVTATVLSSHSGTLCSYQLHCVLQTCSAIISCCPVTNTITARIPPLDKMHRLELRRLYADRAVQLAVHRPCTPPLAPGHTLW